MKAHKDLVEVSEYNEAGYSPIIDYQSWRVAILNYINELEINNIDNFQCHKETDEVFVLLSGKCILFCAEVDEDRNITDIACWNMEPNKAYNIKRGVYHTHTLNEDGKVLIVENSNTSDCNSPKIMIDDTVRNKLGQLASGLWG